MAYDSATPANRMGIYYQEFPENSGTWGVMFKLEGYGGITGENFYTNSETGWTHWIFSVNGGKSHINRDS